MPMKPVDTAIVLSVGPLIDDTDMKSQETGIAYNAAGMSLTLFKESKDGITAEAITLTTGGDNDWTHKGQGIYEVEITAAQNDTEGVIYLEGVCTGVLPFGSPRYGCVAIKVYNSLVAGSDNLEVDTTLVEGSDATTQLAAAVTAAAGDAALDEVVEGTLTLRQIVRLALAVLCGKSSGGNTATVKFRDRADTKDRVSATVDADGNRTAMTLDAS